MPQRLSDPLPLVARRRGRRLAYWNGGLWAVGNGLASTLLVVYLALELDAPGLGLGVGLILAAPNLAGVLRLAAPALVEKLGDRKRFCGGTFLFSALLLAGLPVLAAPGFLATPGASLAALVSLWCAYHLFQYLGTIALWSWLADLVPLGIRGRFIGRRERWMVLGQAGGMLGAGLYAWGWHAMYPGRPHWVAYVPALVLGVGFMLSALVPLVHMPQCATAGLPSSAGDKTNRVACSRLREHASLTSRHGHASEAMPPNAVH